MDIRAYVTEQKPAPMREIADKLGLSRPFLYDLMKGRRIPDFQTARRIADATKGQVPLSSWPHLAEIAAAVQGDTAA